MPNVRTMHRQLRRAVATSAAASVVIGVPAAAAAPSVATDQRCYVVSKTLDVAITGAGFAATRFVDVSVDGVDVGQAKTNATGAFSASLKPGGLAAGQPQSVDRLLANDGTSQAGTTFTVTNTAGARFLAARGNPTKLKAPFELWGFSLTGAPLPVYLHYVAPNGKPRATVSLGRTGGECGYLKTAPKRFFPFTPAVGHWVLQIDTRRHYSSSPTSPVARIRVRISPA